MNQLKPAAEPFLLRSEDLTAPFSNFFLSFGPEKVSVSAPVPGDATVSASSGADSPWVTVGVPARVLPRLNALIGEAGVLFTEKSRRVCELRVEKVDARFNVLVGRLHL